MKKFFCFLYFLIASLFIYAQAFEDKIEFNKQKQACLVIEYNFPPEAVENGIVEKMNQLGYKGKEEKGLFNKDKGFRVYSEAMIADISPGRYDYVIKVDRKSKRDADVALLYLIIMKDNNNALSRLNTEEIANARSFMQNLQPEIEVAHLELQITAQEDVVNKAEKKLKSLKDDKDDMEKRLKKLQDDIKQNEKDQEKQSAEIEDQRKALEALKAKRKGGA